MLAKWHRLALLAGPLCVGGCHEPTTPNVSVPAVADTLFGPDATLWFVADTLGGGLARPAIDQNLVYFGRGEFKTAGEVTARDRTTGLLRWHQQFGTAKNLVVAGNTVSAAWGALGVFDRLTGRPLPWYYPPNDDAIESNAVTDGSLLYAGTYYGQIVAIDPATSTEVWRTPLATNKATIAFGVAVAGDRVVATLKYFPPRGVSVDSGIVAVLVRSTGAVLWRAPIVGGDTVPAAISDPPVVIGNLVVVVTERHYVHAFDLVDGREVWSYDATRGRPGFASYGIAGCDGAIIVSDGDLGLVSLDAATGAERWRLPDLQIGSLERIDCSFGTVMTLSSGILKIFEAQNGALIRRVPADARKNLFVSSVARDADAIYVASERGFGAFVIH